MSKIGLCTISELSVEKFDSSHTEIRKFEIPSYQRGYKSGKTKCARFEKRNVQKSGKTKRSKNFAHTTL